MNQSQEKKNHSCVKSAQEIAWSLINNSMLLDSMQINLAGSEWNEVRFFFYGSQLPVRLAKNAGETENNRSSVLTVKLDVRTPSARTSWVWRGAQRQRCWHLV